MVTFIGSKRAYLAVCIVPILLEVVMREQVIGIRSGFNAPAFTSGNSLAACPNLLPGTIVWRRGETYVAELVERHGMEWMAGVVAAGDAGRASARMCFIPVRELDWA